MRRTLVLTVIWLAGMGAARADSLYVSAPPPAAPGHPMRLGADHKAAQVGDLLSVVFNLSETDSNTTAVTNAKNYNISLGNANGHIKLGFISIPTTGNATSASTSAHSRTGATSFVATMMATVTNVLPSGALQIAGDQRMMVNGVSEVLHVIGMVRPDDIDNTDTIQSTRVANIQAKWDGDFVDPHSGIIKKVLDVLF